VTSAIQTNRLDVVPMTPAFLRASLRRDSAEAAQHLRLKVPDTWPDIASVLALRLEQLESNPSLQPWLLRAMGLRTSREMIGHIGFHSLPGPRYLEQWSPGGVEFGFTVFPAYRRRGFAREASLALMQWARETHGVRSFVVTISPNNRASLALATSLGFVRVGDHEDEVDGREDVYAFNVVPAA
jgi:ribosomal-protein-alanine N-acetyltransferase